MKLVGADRHQVAANLADVERKPAHALGGIAVEYGNDGLLIDW